MIDELRPFSGMLVDDIAAFKGTLAFWWLGQAGFVFRWHKRIFLIDPYLSDFLEQKYAGRQPSHRRMMQAPLGIADLPNVDLVFITHRHGDHLDPVTMRSIQENFPQAMFVLPAAETTYVRSIGLNVSRALWVGAGSTLDLGDGLLLTVLPSAHEEIELDENGNNRFLGFVFAFGDTKIYHSGDSVPHPDVFDAVCKAKPDVALLPVNGRDAVRRSLGIPGNFTLKEAIDLCQKSDVPTMVAHHYGMFAFNTVSEDEIDRAAASNRNPNVFRAKLATRYVIRDGANK